MMVRIRAKASATTSWYLLKVKGGMEASAQRDLHRAGVETVLPMREEWRWRSRYHRGRKAGRELREFALLPGYLAARLADSGLWIEIESHPLVLGVVGYHGTPRPMLASEIDWLRENKRAFAPTWQAHMDTGETYAPGDKVRARGDAFEDVRGEVVAVEGRVARVMVDFFGAAREVAFETYALKREDAK